MQVPRVDNFFPPMGYIIESMRPHVVLHVSHYCMLIFCAVL